MQGLLNELLAVAKPKAEKQSCKVKQSLGTRINTKMNITKQSKIIIKRSTSLNDAIHYDVELWASVGGRPTRMVTAFARVGDTIDFIATNGARESMSLEEFSIALWNLPIISPEELSEDQEQLIYTTILTSGKPFGTIRFDTLPGSSRSGQEGRPFRKS